MHATAVPNAKVSGVRWHLTGARVNSRKASQKAAKPLKQKKCGNPSCRVAFTPSRPLQAVCSPLCAYEKVKADKAKKASKELREGREKQKTKSDHEKAAQASVNAYIRIRDHAEPCISCGKFSKSGFYDAGHYRPTSTHPELRFHQDNIHKQCVRCNQHFRGNLIEYRSRLIEKIGIENVLWLERPHPPAHLTIPDLIEIKKKFARMARELKKKHGA